MDNASKALIMAGAILISIAIVGVGVYIFSQMNSYQDVATGQMNATQISLANSTIRQYEGTASGQKPRGTQVKQMIDYIKSLNKSGAYPNKIIVYSNDSADEPSSAPTEISASDISALKNNYYYQVQVYTNENGYIQYVRVGKGSAKK